MATASPASSDFPSFAELCRQARDFEKSRISIPPSPISGTFGAEESGSIFPKEFETYTFAYMLSEAYKIERNLFATRYQSSVAAGGRPMAGAGDPRITSELQQFSRDARGVPQPQPPTRQVQAPSLQKSAFPVFKTTAPPATVPPQRPVSSSQSYMPQSRAQPRQDSGQAGKSLWPSVTSLPTKAAVPPASEPPPEEGGENKAPYEVEEFEKGAESLPAQPSTQAKPAAKPLMAIPSKKEQERANLIPEEEEEPLPMPDDDEVPLPKPSGDALVPKRGGRLPDDAQDGQTAPAQKAGKNSPSNPLFMSSPKISPRLRAIIEEKMRKDDELDSGKKPGEGAIEANREEEPAPAVEEEQEVVMSSRERLLKKFEKSHLKQKMVSEDFIEGERELSEGELEAGEELEEKRAIDGADEAGNAEGQAEERVKEPGGEKAREYGEEKEKEPDDDIYEDPAHPAPTKKREQEPEVQDSRFAGWNAEKKAGPPKPTDGEEGQKEQGQELPPSVPEYVAPPVPLGKGWLRIQPIFAGEERTQESPGSAPTARRPPAEPADEERNKKIQRIIDELSPDKYKAAALPSSEPEAQAYSKPKPSPKAAKVREEPASAGEGKGMEEEEVVQGTHQDEGPQGGAAPAGKPSKSPAAKKQGKSTKQVRKASKKAAPIAAKPQPAAPKKQVPLPEKGQPSARTLPAKAKPSAQAPLAAATSPAARRALPAAKTPPAAKAKQPAQAPSAEEQPVARIMPADKIQAAVPKKQEKNEPDEGPEKEAVKFPRTLVQRSIPRQSSLEGSGARQPQVPPYARNTSAAPTSASQQGARILPGGITTQSSAYAQTYVQPAKLRAVQPIRRIGQPEPESKPEPPAWGEEAAITKAAVPAGKQRIAPKKPIVAKAAEEQTPEELEQEMRLSTPMDSIRKKLASEREGDAKGKGSGGDGSDGGQGSAPSKPRQKDGDGAQASGESGSEVPLPPKPDGGDGKTGKAGEKQKSALPARPFQQSSREISGEAALPGKEDSDDLPVPMPSAEDKPPEPAPEDYAGAKEQFKRKFAEDELKQEIKAESEETLEQYAKENVIWLYEIYKMGGMTREDFLDKVREQSDSNNSSSGPLVQQVRQPALVEHFSGAPEKSLGAPTSRSHGKGIEEGSGGQPANPALESLNRELEKKAKK